MASVVQKYMKAFKQFGWRETLYKMYSMGEVKFGDLKGIDRNGNKYFENTEYPFGQHRWIEYKDIHNYEPTSIPPEWHGWIHHMTDEIPQQGPLNKAGMKIAEGEHTPYKIALGKSDYKGEDQHNWTVHRQRGYKIGSLNQGPEDPDMYWKQPGHPLSNKKGGRFEGLKQWEEWDPKDPEGKKTKKPIRTLDEN